MRKPSSQKKTKMSENQRCRRVIGFAGRKRSGKGLLTEAICKYHEEKGDRPVVIATIAGALKELCANLLGMTVEESLAIKDNGTILDITMDDSWAESISNVTGIDYENVKKEIDKKKTVRDVREILQFIGTDVIRKYYPDFHIDEAIKKIKASPENAIVVVDDVRFPNELDALAKVDADVFFITRPSCLDITNHVSDTSLHWFDFSIENVLSNRVDAETFVKGFMLWYEKGERDERAFASRQKECVDLEYGDYRFAMIDTDYAMPVIQNILKQNQDVIGGYTNGTMKFIPETSIDREYKLDVMGIQKAISNPLIIENLKMFMV